MGKQGNNPLPAPNAVAGNAARAASYGLTDAILGAIPFGAGPLGGVASGVVGSLLTDLIGDPLANGLSGLFGGQQAGADGAAEGTGSGAGRPMGGMFGPMTQERYDTVMNMLAAAMVGAQQSNSPAAAFLAPIVGSMVGMGAGKQRDAFAAQQSAEGAQALLGRPLTAAEQQAMTIASDPNAPDYLQTIARNMLPKAPATMGGGGATPRRSSSGSSAAPGPAAYTYQYTDKNGVRMGYNKRTGQVEPVPVSGAQPSGPTAGQPVVPAPPPDPVLPRDPGSAPGGTGDLSDLTDEELLSRYR